MEAERKIPAEETANNMENDRFSITEISAAGERLIAALQEIVEKENELLRRLEELLCQLEPPAEHSPESETADQKRSIFITSQRSEHGNV